MNNSFKFVNVNKLLSKNKFKGAIIGGVSKKDYYQVRRRNMLRKTKNFLRAHGVEYEKEHVNPLMVPERVYVLKFGKKDGKFLNRFIVEHSYTWTGRDKINKITLRLHGQQHPREFANEAKLLQYLKKHAHRYVKEKDRNKHTVKRG